MKKVALLSLIVLFLACPSAPKNSAKIYLDRGEYESAREQIMQGLKEDPNDYELYCLLAKVEIGLTKWVPASDAFLKAIAIDSTLSVNWILSDTKNVSVYWQAFYNAAVGYVQEKEYNKSLKNLGYCRIIDPKNVNLYILLGRIYTALDEKEKASQAYEDALAIDPENPEAYFSIGEVYYDRKMYDSSVVKFNQSIKYFKIKYDKTVKVIFQNVPFDKTQAQTITKLWHEKKTDELNEFIKVKLGFENPSTQKRTIEQFYKTTFGFARAYYMAGMSNYNLNKDTLALQNLNKSLDLMPEDIDALYFTGELLMVKLHRFKDAITYFKKVTEIQPDDLNAWYYMGASYYHDKEYQKAIEILEEKVLVMDAKNIDAMTYLASAYKEIGNNKKSYEYLMKADQLQKEK